MKLAINGGEPFRKIKLQYGKQTIDESDKQAVRDVLDENTYLTTGPRVVDFEKKVCEFVNAKYGVAVNSGTSALHLAVDALNLSKTDEVIVTCMSFVASSNAIVYCGVKPVFCDINTDTMNIDTTKIEFLINQNTKAILTVDFTGQTCDYNEIRKIANKYNLKIIEDAAHSIGISITSLDKKPMVGSFADITTFSFHPVKNITTCEGGMCVTNNEEYYKKMKAFRAHGIHSDYRERQTKSIHYYEMTDLGYNYRIPDLLCALGINQLKRLPEWIKKRQEIAKYYNTKLLSLNKYLSPLKQIFENAYHIYIIKLNLENLTATRDQIYAALHAEGLGVNVHYIPIHLHPFYKKTFGTYKGMMPVAEDCYERILTLPIYPSMSNKDMQDTINILTKVLIYYKK
jgi:perosamine synthetase